ESTQLHHSDYSFEDAKAVLFGLSDFLQGSKPFVPYENLKKWLPLIESVKNVLMGRHAQLIRMNQWKESLNSVIDLHGLVLKYRYVIQNLDFSQRQDVRQMSQFANQALTLIENSQQIKMAGMIPKEDIDELIHQLLPFMHFDFTLREISVKKLYRVVLLRMLSPERGDGFEKDTRGFMGLTKENLEALRREFNIWRMGQSFADSVKLNDSQKIAQKTLLESYDKFNINYVISQGLTKDALEETALKNSWRDFGDLLKSPILVNFNKKGRLIEATNPTLYDVSWKSLTKMNLMRSLARMLTLGYGDKTANRLSDSGINKPGLISWYDDFNEFGLDVKAFDPRTGNAGSRSFLEANFFTFSGNGDDRMDQRETFEFVSVLISAGLGTSDEVRKDMKVCEALEVKADVFGYNYLHEECFKKRFRENAMYYLDNMPRMVAYIKNLSDPDYEAFYNHLKTAAETIDQKQDLIETANIRTMITVLHYVESVMVTYDADKNQTLSLSEIYAAAPRFMSFLKTIKSVKYDFIAKEGFAYLVLTGEVPRDGWRGAWDLAKFQTVKNGLPEADRKDILALFGTLKQELNKKPN
ncbi:MAG TPA: hypothetical protein VN132_04150, partial [Bdellovibrio sp.]|nr:hypothetical protein [Bdellovibrio sp.]